jgi:hypothetical protein
MSAWERPLTAEQSERDRAAIAGEREAMIAEGRAAIAAAAREAQAERPVADAEVLLAVHDALDYELTWPEYLARLVRAGELAERARRLWFAEQGLRP